MSTYHQWTQSEIKWLNQNIGSYSYKNIQAAFNAHFNTNLTQSSIEHACLRRGITHGRKDECGFVKNEHNSFSQARCIGDEYTDSRGRVFVKVSDNVVSSGKNKRANWMQKDRYIWENTYGKLSKNDLLIHLNSDKNDCSIENLYKTNRAVIMLMSANKWYFIDKSMTLTAIKCCELIVLLSERSIQNDRA